MWCVYLLKSDSSLAERYAHGPYEQVKHDGNMVGEWWKWEMASFACLTDTICFAWPILLQKWVLVTA